MMALRILLLACIESLANHYKRFIVLYSLCTWIFMAESLYAFSCALPWNTGGYSFENELGSASEMKNAPLKLSYVYQRAICDSYHLQSLGRTTAKNNRVR